MLPCMAGQLQAKLAAGDEVALGSAPSLTTARRATYPTGSLTGQKAGSHMPYGVAVLGTGRIGGSYIDVVKKTPGAEIKVVAEPNEEAAATWRERHPDVDFVADYRHTLGRDDVHVVIGALPHWLHYQAALDAAAAGKHIYMEKPIAVWAWQAEEMLAAARRNGVKLMTAHTQRYYPTVKAMKEVVDRGELGPVIMAYDVWHKSYGPYGRPPWMLDRERGGGMGQMDGTHQIDRLLWIIGCDVATVSAQQGQFTYPRSEHPGINCDDTGMYFIRWKSGVVAAVSRIAWERGANEYGGDWFFGKGMARFRLPLGGGDPPALFIADTGEGTWRRQEVPARNSLLDQFTAFVQSLERGDEDTPVPQDHGLKVLKVLEATEESARTGREVVLDLE